MKTLDIKALLGFDLCDINKEFDNALYNKALQIRKETANILIDNDDPSWQEQDLINNMLQSVLERAPFQNTEKVLKFNLAITEKACDWILQGPFSVFEKIGIFAYIVEIGAREFISPENTDLVYKNLSAAKEKGFFFTPPSVAIRMVINSIYHASVAESVLDPAAGVGVFLAYHILLNRDLKHITGIEINQHTAMLAEKLLRYVSVAVESEAEIEVINDSFFEFFEKVKEKYRSNLIIMNPPYGAVKVLASDLTDASTKANLSEVELVELEKKLKNQTIRYANQLRNQFAQYGMGKGTLEYSKLFMAATLQLLSDDGILVSITPSSWLGDETSSDFRKKIISSKYLKELWIIPEKSKLFKGVNQPTVVSILCNKPSSKVKVFDPVMRIEEVDGTPELFNIKSVLDVSGEKVKFPQCTEESLRLLEKISNFGKVRDISGLVNMRGELDLTAYKKFIEKSRTEHRLVRGDHIQGSVLGSADSSDKAGYVHFDAFMKAIEQSEKAQYINYERIAIPQCSYLQKKKRIEAAIIPGGMVLANSCNFITVAKTDQTQKELYYYWMVMNSSVVEWQFRIFSYNNHVANKEIDALTCVPYDRLTKTEKRFIGNLVEKKNKEFTPLMDAFIAQVFKISFEEYGTVLKSIDKDDKELCLKEYKQMDNKRENIPQHQMPYLSELDKVMISYVEPGGNWTSIPETVLSKRLDQIREMARTRGMVRTTYYSRLRYNQPAYTISTYFNRPGNGANIHPWEDRTLSSREAARLQSFPDYFIFEGNDAAVRTQIGNAVPPLLGYAIGTAIKKKVGRTLQFCDMFAGAGGLSFGMEMAGYKGVAALELNKSAAATFAINHNPEIKTIVGDINDEGIQSELFEAIEQRIESDTPWVLVGGPPCQGFSTAGYRDENDIRNQLVDSYLKIIQKTQPTIVVMENVPGILSMKKGDVIKGVYQALHRLGYVFHQNPWVLDAEQYGVPQMRKRVIIVAAKSEEYLPDCPSPTFRKCLGRREQVESQMSFNEQPYPITVGEALTGLPPLMEINDYFPKEAVIDGTYDEWCRGKISIEDLLIRRGK